MKERVRQALFNILGERPVGTVALDLFAGTGVLGIEAISRGAVRGFLVERDRGHLVQLRENISRLKLDDRLEVLSGDAFRGDWLPRMPEDTPWVVFCCPPYAFYQDLRPAMAELIRTIISRAPGGSTLVVEADTVADFPQLTPEVPWDIRSYPPAILAIADLAAPTRPPLHSPVA